MLILHIIIALTSLIITGATAFVPTRGRIRASAVSIVLMAVSGALLAVFDHSQITHVCMTGLAYLAIEGAAVAIATVRLRQRAGNN